jgi:tetratricopeptide (TPR) repeat protein
MAVRGGSLESATEERQPSDDIWRVGVGRYSGVMMRGLFAKALSAVLVGGVTWCALAQGAAASPKGAAGQKPAADAMEFEDGPQMKVAGVTDWTAVGGHGSDATLKTSESLANATAGLKGAGGGSGAGESYRLAGERDEAKGDPLAAVQEFEKAATVEPSEANLFAWGSELLVHRAVWQAEVVFRKGALAFPQSVRMQTGLGTALFAGARYAEAAERLCAASDLDTEDVVPYEFLGKVQIAAPGVLACAAQRLARFVKMRPESAEASYLYGMALLKSGDARAEGMFKQAVKLDPKCAEAELQLGVMAASRKDNEGAIVLYKRAITAQPGLADAYYRLAVAYDRVGKEDEAKAAFAEHDRVKREQAAATEKERMRVKQFLFAKDGAVVVR